jgi:hypothetical protein
MLEQVAPLTPVAAKAKPCAAERAYMDQLVRQSIAAGRDAKKVLRRMLLDDLKGSDLKRHLKRPETLQL